METIPHSSHSTPFKVIYNFTILKVYDGLSSSLIMCVTKELQLLIKTYNRQTEKKATINAVHILF